MRRRALPLHHVADLASLVEEFGRKFDEVGPSSTGSDCFIKKRSKTVEDGESIADRYARLGLKLSRANVDRVNGVARFMELLGDTDGSPVIEPRLSVFSTCTHLIEQIPGDDPRGSSPEDVKKVDVDDDGNGGDDAYDAARYGLMVDSVGAADPVVVMDGSGEW